MRGEFCPVAFVYIPNTTPFSMSKTIFKTPLTYYGGKQRLLHHILPLIPEHRIYTEAFCGGAAVFWGKEQSPVEVINDLNEGVVGFWRILKTEFDALKMEVELTPHSREVYKDAMHVLERPHLFDDLKVAWAFWTACTCGFSSKPGSWGYDLDSTTTKKILNKKLTFGPHLAERLARTQIEKNDGLKVIASRDSVDAFHYVDPPYHNSDCGHYKGYTEADFEALLQLLGTVKGKFLLSSYPSELLAKYTEKMGWHQVSVIQTLAVTGKRATGKKKTEVLTANYPISLS